MTKAEIKINTDVPCKRCGRKESCQNGYCLKCTADIIENQTALVNKAVANSTSQVSNLLENYASDIYEAYVKSEGDFSVGLTVEFKQSEKSIDTINVKAKINFITGRIKAESVAEVTTQEKLPI